MMKSKKLLFQCYECDKMFSYFEFMRSHVLFTHNHVVEKCDVNTDKLLEKWENGRKEKERKQNKEYYQTHKKQIYVYHKRYYLKNRDKALESMARYYQKNKEILKERKIERMSIL